MKDKQLSKAKNDILDNLDAIQMALDNCEKEGLVDYESAHYNKLSDLIEDARLVKTWDEVMEIVALARTLEEEVDAWLSFHGRASMSLDWPHRPVEP